MLLGWLEATGFRCYRHVEFHPRPGVNVLVGDNGSGKTSLLEAIGYLATLASFRRSPDAALIGEGADTAVVRGEWSRGERSTRVEVEIPHAGRRRALLNGKRLPGRSMLAEVVGLVTFLPDDLDLVKRGPALRREYLDDAAAQLWPAAAADQAEYERALRQRNALLRREGRRADRTTLDVWDERLSILGARVVGRRLAALDSLGPRLDVLYAGLVDVPEPVGWQYVGGGIGRVEGSDGLTERLANAVAAARETDLERRTTTVGPHRDELVLTLGGRDVRTRASQGEQRSVALGMRMASYEALREQRGVPPVLVLDDVFSELDVRRSARLVERLPEGQVFVTTARREEVPLDGTVWSVGGGSVGER
jgi:DNA replication and repair protein RecF